MSFIRYMASIIQEDRNGQKVYSEPAGEFNNLKEGCFYRMIGERFVQFDESMVQTFQNAQNLTSYDMSFITHTMPGGFRKIIFEAVQVRSFNDKCDCGACHE